MKVNKIILRDAADTLYDDLITFENDVLLEDISKIIEEVKENIEDYTVEDVYKALTKLGNYTLEWIGDYKIIEY